MSWRDTVQKDGGWRSTIAPEEAPPAANGEGWGTRLARSVLAAQPGLGDVSNVPAPEMPTGKELVRGGLEALPGIGAIAGGVAGGASSLPAMGVGAIPAAALGYAGGKNLERLGKEYFLNESDRPKDLIGAGKQLAGDLTEGAAFEAGGQVAGKALEAAPSVGNYIANRMRSGAEKLAVSHLRPTATMRRSMGSEDVRAAGREALDSGAIGFGNNAEKTAENLGNLVDEVGAVKGDIVNASPATIDPNAIAGRVQSEVINPLRATSETQPIANTIQGKSDAFLKQYPGSTMTPAQLEAEKMAVQGNINYNASSSAQTTAAENYARVLREGVEGAVDDPAFIAAKRAFKNLSNAEQMATRTGSMAEGGLMSHMTDVGIGHAAASAAMHGNPVGLGVAGARALTKGRMSSSGAVALDRGSKAVQALMSSKLFTEQQLSRLSLSPYFQALKNAGNAGGADAVATTHYVLQQTDPGYQELLKDEQQ